ncbi:DUF2147 domain-containing protein [Comamonas nitrativorans]|uniref:DUF2147 domain-containing protein n=1 Tax=Comamonas nitrativorans TaxID=108437 RepID=A0ABV9GUH8_9BURK
MKKLQALAAIALSALALPSLAQMTPVGTWKSMDDKTGQPKSQIVIADQGGVLEGRIDQLLRPGADPKALCVECKDALKNQPMVGLPIIQGAKKAADKDVWEDGKILDPENGKFYTLRLTPIEGGQKLEVRGSIGPFGRTQTWVRVQ